jgi:EmrB/QacA subfamily drug resistance transporter
MNIDRRWIALVLLCMGGLMIVIDTSIVNIALPSIRSQLGFSESALAWVVNAYTLTFGGFLLLGGRLGDLFGKRRLFLIGLAIFTLASLACGLAATQLLLIAARAIQGIGGAIVSAVALSLLMDLFAQPGERARAMGVYGFVAAGGGSLGVVIGGLLVNSLDWHWVFLVNIPIGIIVFALSIFLVPKGAPLEGPGHLDIAGAITITASLMLAVYGIVNGNSLGWTSLQTILTLGLALILFTSFLVIESRVKGPLMPLTLFKNRNLSVAGIIGILWSASMFTWFFLSALYLQIVLNYSPLSVGLAFLPGNVIMAIFSLWLSALIVNRYGIRYPIAIGMLLVAIGLILFSRAPVDGKFIIDVLPGMVLLGLGAGLALNPVLLAAMSEVSSEESGLASGVVNTSFMMGGALGLAILASLAAARSSTLTGLGVDHITALNSGYHAAFLMGACFALLAALLGGILIRSTTNTDPQIVSLH